MKKSRIILLKDISTPKEFIQFTSSYSLYSGGYICCRSLFSLMGFGDKVLSTRIKNYASACDIENIVIIKNQGIKYFLVTEPQAYSMVQYFQNKNLVYGHGIRDVDFPVKVNGKLIPSYRKWCGMLERCYSEEWHRKKPSYKECQVSDEWLLFSNFHSWFCEHAVEGYVLDKDIMQKNNKIYSKEKCVFVPSRINNLLIKRQNDRGEFPQGVIYRKDRLNKSYEAACSDLGKRKHIGFFNCPNEAFLAYKNFKEESIKRIALEYFYKKDINKRVLDALFAYKVEHDD